MSFSGVAACCATKAGFTSSRGCAWHSTAAVGTVSVSTTSTQAQQPGQRVAAGGQALEEAVLEGGVERGSERRSGERIGLDPWAGVGVAFVRVVADMSGS
jgi:hypothetical protein